MMTPQRQVRNRDRQFTGSDGESLACTYLQQRGYRILERNWHSPYGELDIVATDGQFVVAVEVKTRRGLNYGHPLEAITADKAARLRRLFAAWLAERRPRAARLRIDAIGVILIHGAEPQIVHVEGIS